MKMGVGEKGDCLRIQKIRSTGSGGAQRQNGAGIQVIARAAAILRALKAERYGLTLAEIAERVELPRSTVQRISGALHAEKLLIAAGPDGGLRLGPELYSLAEAARFDLVRAIRPLLQDLSRDTGETVDLAILRGRKLIFIDQIPGRHRLRTISFVGAEFPLTPTANGKACLALLPIMEVRKIAQAEWGTRNFARQFARLQTELQTVRQTGIAFDLDEHTDGISAVGTAFRDENAECYAVSIPTPSQRFAQSRGEITAAIGRFAHQIKELRKSNQGGV